MTLHPQIRPAPVAVRNPAKRPQTGAIQRAASESDTTQRLADLQQIADSSPLVQRLRMTGQPIQRAEDDKEVQFKIIQRVDDEKEKQLKPIQRAEQSGRGGLPAPLKAGIESLSGLSMDHVQVHRNSAEPAKVGAHAYAQGSQIHLAPGQDRHLPHEAWHVVQQAQGRVRPTLQLKGVSVNDDPGLEKEADTMGAQAAQFKLAPGGLLRPATRTGLAAPALVQRLVGGGNQPGTDQVLPGVANSRRAAALKIANFINLRARQPVVGGNPSDTATLAANSPGNLYVRSDYTVGGNAARLETWSEMTDAGGGYVKRVRITEAGAVLMDRVMNDPAPTALNTALAADAGGGGGHQFAAMHGTHGNDAGSLDISNTDDRSADNITKVVGEGARFGWLASKLANGTVGNTSRDIFNVTIKIPQAGKLTMNPTFQALWGAWRSGFGRSYLKDKNAAKALLQQRVRERFRPVRDSDVLAAGSVAHGAVAGGQVTSLLSRGGQLLLIPTSVGGISGGAILSDFSMTWSADH